MTAILAIGGIFISAFMIGFSGAIMPGPLLAVTISESARRGPWAGPRLMVGHALLEAILVTAVILGLAPVLASTTFQIAISIIGGSIMAWMGSSMLRTAHRLSLSTAETDDRGMNCVTAGALMSVSNPFWIIWWATIGMAYMLMGLEWGVIGVLAFFTGHILSDFTWYTVVSVTVAKGRNLLPDGLYRGVIRVCALVLLIFAAYFLGRGIGQCAA